MEFVASSKVTCTGNPPNYDYWDQRDATQYMGDWSVELKSTFSSAYSSTARPNNALRSQLTELCKSACMAKPPCAYYQVSSDAHWHSPGFVCVLYDAGNLCAVSSGSFNCYQCTTPTITTRTSITFTEDSGLNLASGQGAAKVVLSLKDCSLGTAGGGTSEVTDLGPDDSTSATSASAAFTCVRWHVQGVLQAGGRELHPGGHQHRHCHHCHGSPHTNPPPNPPRPPNPPPPPFEPPSICPPSFKFSLGPI